MQIDRAGTFLVKEIDRALGQTKKQGLPQLTIRVQVVNYFDQVNEEWVDFSEYEMETNAYFTLAFNGKDGMETSMSYDQIMKVYDWDGRDFQMLTEIASPELFMVKVKDNDPEYAAKNPFVVDWIDTADTDPHGGLKKLDTAGVQALQVQFGALLNKKGKATPPASAKKAPSIVSTSTIENAADTSVDSLPLKQTTPKSKKAAKLAKSKHIAEENARLEAGKAPNPKVKAPPTAPKTAVVSPPVETEEVTGSKTKQEAYEFVYEMQAAGVTDEQRNNAWNAAIMQVAGDVDQKTISGEQWYRIMHETLDGIGAV